MKRQHPFLSTYGIAATTVLLVVLGVILWRSGGKAFSPGRLTAISRPTSNLDGYTSHADFESKCSLCHKPLETTQDALCLSCHTNVTIQMRVKDGTHGNIEDVRQCAACHKDHQGAEFDPTLGAYQYFDHDKTTLFSLVRHQLNFDTSPINCEECHIREDIFTLDITKCVTCHAANDSKFMLQHINVFGGDCTACHDGQDRLTQFNHQDTRFPLEGVHKQIVCTDCHVLSDRMEIAGEQSETPLNLFSESPRDCIACHAEPEMHLGMFGSDCRACHTTDSWSPATLDGRLFKHSTQTGFALSRHYSNFTDQPVVCNDCHRDDLPSFTTESCVTCHAHDDETIIFMDGHLKQFGMDCLSCHDGVDRMHDFNHDNFFLIDGKHAELDCQACHANKVFAGTPAICVDCHAEPEIHAGYFGLRCEYCHSSYAWFPAPLKVHLFPLNHGVDYESECTVCHQERYLEYSCYGCHEHQAEAISQRHNEAGIPDDKLPDCVDCHKSGMIDKSNE